MAQFSMTVTTRASVIENESPLGQGPLLLRPLVVLDSWGGVRLRLRRSSCSCCGAVRRDPAPFIHQFRRVLPADTQNDTDLRVGLAQGVPKSKRIYLTL